MDYSKYATTSAIPEASSMIETFRAIGYNTESAIADVVDNSISAGAKNVWINFEWLGSETWLSIKDDGYGMNNEELIQAMRPGSKHPFDQRDTKDLGRFGLGLKTASFSQCRQLSVISKKNLENPVFWTWDLDFVNQTGRWELINYLPSDKFANEVMNHSSGTIVIWNELDRMVKNVKADDKVALGKFLHCMDLVKKNLSMVFHRFISDGRIKLWFQDRLVEAWNPFLENEPATQIFPEEPMQNGNIKIKGFVLPHKSKISEELFRKSEGPKGWNDHQGFYIYRNERMLLAGDWLGFWRKEEHYKLARIMVDIPNTLDTEWQIDIKKSVARPPNSLKDQLRAYAGIVRAQAVEIYRHKGRSVKQVPGQKFVPLWIDHKRGDKWFYKINREHPFIEDILNEAVENPVKAIELLLRYIEETIPAKSIYIREAENPDALGKPFEGTNHEPIQNAMKLLFHNLLAQGKTDLEAKALISYIEPFNHFPHFLDLLQ